MNYSRTSVFSTAPKLLQWIIILMGAFPLLATQVKSFFGFISPHALFGLSAWGLKHGFVWQLLSYAFLYPHPLSLSFSLLLSLFFNLYLLFFVSLSIITLRSMRDFCFLFFGGLLFTGLSVATLLFTTGAPFVYCSTSSAIFLMLTAWMMIDPERQILLFMTLPIKIKWLALIFFGGQILIEFVNGHFIEFTGLFFPCLYAWLFSILRWEINSPFAFLNRLENSLIRLKHRIGKRWQNSNIQYVNKEAKVYDFKTGQAIMDDEHFMDVCLSKVSKYGEESLSWKEKLRMRRISKKQMKKKAF